MFTHNEYRQVFMVRIFPFGAIRPDPGLAPRIASVPYDVVSAEEACIEIDRNPLSFLRVSRSDAELSELPPNDERVYALARKNFEQMLSNDMLREDSDPSYYLYHVIDGDRTYTGLVACLSVDDYIEGRIRRHELTRYDKEADRTRHIDTVNANTGLVFLLYQDPGSIYPYLEGLVPAAPKVAEVAANNRTVHQIYPITDAAARKRIEDLLDGVCCLYIADGHHRAASAVNVARERRAAGTANDESQRFMAVLFAHDRVKIHGYSRLVRDLDGMAAEAFLARLEEVVEVHPYGTIEDARYRIPPSRSREGMHIFHMYLAGTWYELAKAADPSADAIHALDVTVLQEAILQPLLGISDPRSDPRLHYMGGAKPLSELEGMVDGGQYAVAFAMQPVTVDQVFAIADAGMVMPPKSTWFEPKLLSGLIVHRLE